MKKTNMMHLVVLALLVGCNRSDNLTRWEEVQFKMALRPVPYASGDVSGSGPFEDLLHISLPVAVTRGKGSAHVVQDGAWFHLQWDSVREDAAPEPMLVFEGLKYRFENRFASPYGPSWRAAGWQELGTRGVLCRWDLLDAPVGIDPSGEDRRVWCKLFRWVPRKTLTDIRLGGKKEGEQSNHGDV